jgi:hypothetical protein
VTPQGFAVAHQHHGAVELMGLAGQLEQMAAGAFHVVRFVEHFVAERQRLVTAKHQPAGMLLADGNRFGFGQDEGDLLGRCTAFGQRRFQRPFVEVGRDCVDWNAGIFEHGVAEGASGSKDEFFGHWLYLKTNRAAALLGAFGPSGSCCAGQRSRPPFPRSSGG